MPINLINNKAKGLLFMIVLLVPALVFSQPKKKPGSIEYLKLCNGFNGICLGSDINLVPNAKLAFLDGDYKLDADSCLKYQYRDMDFLKVGDNLNLNLVGFRTYKNKIVNIYLFFKRADGYKVLSNFIASYGVFTDKPNDYQDIYNWNSSTMSLSLAYELKLDYGVAIFTSKSLENEIEIMKKIRDMKQMEASQTRAPKISVQY
jgi:hypothetical protein